MGASALLIGFCAVNDDSLRLANTLRTFNVQLEVKVNFFNTASIFQPFPSNAPSQHLDTSNSTALILIPNILFSHLFFYADVFSKTSSENILFTVPSKFRNAFESSTNCFGKHSFNIKIWARIYEPWLTYRKVKTNYQGSARLNMKTMYDRQ